MVSVHSRPDRPITVRGADINGYFVAGSDTEVGKTVVAACLVRALDADYWKPVETGLEQGSDTTEVLRLTGLPADRLHPSAYALQVPLSPHEAARLEGVEIALDAFVLPATGRPLVVEGAGGLMVPLNRRHFMIDLIERLGLPVILVVRSGLGTINHTLLSLDALRSRSLPVEGVILNGPLNPANRAAIEYYGEVRVLAEIPRLETIDRKTVSRLSAKFTPVLKGKLA